MPTAVPSSNVTLPVPHESSGLRSARDSDDVRASWKRQAKQRDQIRSDRNAIEMLTRKVDAMRRRVLGGAAIAQEGWYWVDGEKLYSPLERGVAKNQIVKVTQDNPVVTDGITCAGSVLQKATPGTWIALQDVDILAGDGTDNPAKIPQLPMPGGTDPDNAGNYWALVTPSSLCISTGPVEV